MKTFLQFTFNWSDTIFLLLGTYDLSLVFACFFVAFIGAILSLRQRGKIGVKLNDTSPQNFDWGYLIADKFWNFFTGILLVAVTLRFTSGFIAQKCNDNGFNPVLSLLVYSFVVGYSHYLLGNLLFKAVAKLRGKATVELGIAEQNKPNENNDK